jgi:hypothetical protein
MEKEVEFQNKSTLTVRFLTRLLRIHDLIATRIASATLTRARTSTVSNNSDGKLSMPVLAKINRRAAL